MVRVSPPPALAGLLAAAALALGACSDDPSLEAPPAGEEAPLAAAEARFEASGDGFAPGEVSVPFATPVRLAISSADGRAHEVVLEDGLGPGEDATVDVPADGEGAADVGPFDPGRYALRLAEGEGSATLVVEE